MARRKVMNKDKSYTALTIIQRVIDISTMNVAETLYGVSSNIMVRCCYVMLAPPS